MESDLNKIKISDFYNSDFVNYSSYDNLRKIAQIDGHKNAFQEFIPTNIQMVIIDGFAIGTNILQRNFQSPAPSTLAA